MLEGKEGEVRKCGPQRSKEKMTVWCQAPRRIQEVGGATVMGDLPGIKATEYEDLGWRGGKGAGRTRPPCTVEPPRDFVSAVKAQTGGSAAGLRASSQQSERAGFCVTLLRERNSASK